MSEDTWTETGITYNNAPALGSSFGSSGTFSGNAWTTVDVTSYITGNGTYNLGFSTTSSTNVSYSSREGANAPQLVIETGGTPSGLTSGQMESCYSMEGKLIAQTSDLAGNTTRREA